MVHFAGLFVTALGAATAVNSNLGISPISSVPYVLSRIFPVSMGTFAALSLIGFVFLQMLLLRREFRWLNLTQILSSSVYGVCVDVARFLIGDFRLPTYFGQLTMLAVSITFIVAGTALLLLSKFPILPSGSLCVALAQKTNIAFSRIKVAMDCTMAGISIALSFLFLGNLIGVREGTVITAILVGSLIPLCIKLLIPILRTLGVPVEQSGKS